jgi:hypothetical protein
VVFTASQASCGSTSSERYATHPRRAHTVAACIAGLEISHLLHPTPQKSPLVVRPTGSFACSEAAASTPSRPHPVCPSCSLRVSRARYCPLLVSAWKTLNPISYPASAILQLFVPVSDRFAEVDLNIWDDVRCLTFPLSTPAALRISSRKTSHLRSCRFC